MTRKSFIASLIAAPLAVITGKKFPVTVPVTPAAPVALAATSSMLYTFDSVIAFSNDGGPLELNQLTGQWEPMKLHDMDEVLGSDLPPPEKV